MWLSDAEQKELLKDGPITERVNRLVAVAVRQREERLKQLQQKVAEHEIFLSTIRRGLSGIVKTGKQ